MSSGSGIRKWVAWAGCFCALTVSARAGEAPSARGPAWEQPDQIQALIQRLQEAVSQAAHPQVRHAVAHEVVPPWKQSIQKKLDSNRVAVSLQDEDVPKIACDFGRLLDVSVAVLGSQEGKTVSMSLPGVTGRQAFEGLAKTLGARHELLAGAVVIGLPGELASLRRQEAGFIEFPSKPAEADRKALKALEETPVTSDFVLGEGLSNLAALAFGQAKLDWTSGPGVQEALARGKVQIYTRGLSARNFLFLALGSNGLKLRLKDGVFEIVLAPKR